MRILILQLKRIGDLILTTPAIWALRENLPGARLTLAADAACRELLPGIDYVDETLTYQRRGQNSRTFRRLIFGHFDACLDFTSTDRSALFGVLSKAPRRATFEWVHRSGFRHMFYNQFIASSVRENHTVDHYIHLLRALSLPNPVRKESPIMLRIPEWADHKAGQLLAEAGLSQPAPFILVHPGAARPEKFWPADRWAQIILWAEANLGIPCLLSGSADGHEQTYLKRIVEAAPSVAPRDISGRLDLLTLASLTRSASLVISVDSAPMHMAGAFRTPQVALFGPTNPFHWRPRHPRALIVQPGLDPAVQEFRPQHPGALMTEISTQMVIDAMVALHVHA